MIARAGGASRLSTSTRRSASLENQNTGGRHDVQVPAARAGGRHHRARSALPVPGHGGDARSGRAPDADLGAGPARGEGRPRDVRLHQRAAPTSCSSGSTPCATTGLGFPCGWPARRSWRWCSTAPPTTTPTAPRPGTRTAYALPNVITAVGAGDFEGTVTFGLGVQKRTSYTVTKLQNPDRVVVDVRAGFPTTTRKVWLVDTDAVETGNEPYFVPRQRPIRSDAPGRRRAARPVRRADPAGAGGRAAAGALPRLGVRRPADRRRHRPGPADPRLQQQRFDDHGRGRDRADPAAVPDGGLGQDLRSRWQHRAAQGQVDSIPTCLEP